ncbi:MAG TPA: hypothetical protein VFW39_01890 [Sphingomicrobium sp.]|nr:hypothetical protein [Sphingomicrobium sp.]
MATLAGRFFQPERQPDRLSGTERAQSLDRWIFVVMAAWFILIVLGGFVPDAIMKVGLVEAGKRPPFPIAMHVHAVAMGSFMLLLLTQSVLMATGRRELHMRLGMVAFAFVPLLVVIGFILAPTMYHQVSDALPSAPPTARPQLQKGLLVLDNILLAQINAGILFALFMTMALRARTVNSGLHKRMIFLATAMPLPAAIARMTWLPNNFPASPLGNDFWLLVALSPLFLWDVIRNRRVHEAYIIWFAIYAPCAVLVDAVWDKPWWHSTARAIMGV